MPITVTAARGVLTPEGEREILPRLTEALVAASGLTGNAFFEPVVGGTVHVEDPGDVYAGGVATPLVMVEVKLPHIGLPDPASRAAFIESASTIVGELTHEGHRDDHTWVNILNAPDAGWGFSGRAWADQDLVAAITAASA